MAHALCVGALWLAFTTSLASSTNIVASLHGTGAEEIFVKALAKANLTTTLEGTHPFTVFAPTDTAFHLAYVALKTNEQEFLNRADLGDILRFHMLPGKFVSSDIPEGTTQAHTTYHQGAQVNITKDSSGMKFDSAKVTTADVIASNGVIHAIDTVVLPPTVNIAATTISRGVHSIFIEALRKANLLSALQGAGPLTVFAPTDDAFATLFNLLKINRQQFLDRRDLADILNFHMLSGKIATSALTGTQNFVTLEGEQVDIIRDGDGVKFANALVTAADVETSNGVIHVIDRVVLPPKVDIMGTPRTPAQTAPKNEVFLPPRHEEATSSARASSVVLISLACVFFILL